MPELFAQALCRAPADSGVRSRFDDVSHNGGVQRTRDRRCRSLFLYIVQPRFLWLDLSSIAFIGALASVFFFFAYLGFKSAWEASERYSVRPPSSVTSAFSFSDDLAALYEPERHVYTVTNPAFAAAFIELNRDRTWRPDGRAAHVARRKRSMTNIVIGIIVALLVLYGLLDDFGLLPFK